MVLALATALGIGLWLSALNVRYRDVLSGRPFVIMVGLFVSPITYPFHLVPADLRPFYALNPIVGRARDLPLDALPYGGMAGARSC